MKYVASRVATGLPASVEQADLVSYGMFGLIDALTKFEPGRGNKFETYAIPRIKGAIIDELRAMDWVPRSVRFKAREIEKAHADLEAMLKRQPTEKELAERLGISLRELHDVVSQISFVSVLALDEMVSVGADRGEQVSLIDTLADKGVDPTSGRRVAGDAWAARRRDQLAVRAGEDRRHALLLRGAHARGDRRDPRRHRVPRLPDPHEGGRRAPRPALRVRLTSRSRSDVTPSRFARAPPARSVPGMRRVAVLFLRHSRSRSAAWRSPWPPPAAAAGDWAWPVVGPVIRGYDPPALPYGSGHRGIDIAAPIGHGDPRARGGHRDVRRQGGRQSLRHDRSRRRARVHVLVALGGPRPQGRPVVARAADRAQRLGPSRRSSIPACTSG